MLGKLLKYDLRSMVRQFAFIWPAALAVAFINRFTIKSFITSASDMRQTVSGVSMLVYVAILMAMFIVALLFVVQRFYRGLLGDEGYLMFTLPVRSWQLILSKLLCALLATALSVLTAALSILIIVPVELSELLDAALRLLSALDGTAALVLLEWLLLALSSCACGYLMFYLSMAIGHLFSKNRVLMSVAAFLAISVAMDLIGSLVGSAAAEVGAGALMELVMDAGTWAAWHTVVWSLIAYTAIPAIAFFFLTNYILQHRLNLE